MEEMKDIRFINRNGDLLMLRMNGSEVIGYPVRSIFVATPYQGKKEKVFLVIFDPSFRNHFYQWKTIWKKASENLTPKMIEEYLHQSDFHAPAVEIDYNELKRKEKAMKEKLGNEFVWKVVKWKGE